MVAGAKILIYYLTLVWLPLETQSANKTIGGSGHLDVNSACSFYYLAFPFPTVKKKTHVSVQS